MSKIGKKPIKIPAGVTVTEKDQSLIVSGPKGEVVVPVLDGINIVQKEGVVEVKPANDQPQTRAFWGLVRSLISNAIDGVTDGFEKELELVGVGYRVQKKGTGIELEVGYSHSISYDPPEGVVLEVEKGVIKVTGINKQQVGQVSAQIRGVRPPEPYKGKGIRYVGEEVHLKPGKSAKVGAA